MPDPRLEARGIEVQFGGLRALAGVDLAVGVGEIAGLIGPNGAGKTTLFNVVTGVQDSDSGRVLLDGEDITAWSPHRRGRAGIARTFQRLALYTGLTVHDNLLATWEAVTPGGVLGRNRQQGRARVNEVIDQLALGSIAGRLAGQLSTGLGRMVELGRALCANPRILLLDEPSAGLDPDETAQFSAILRQVAGGDGDRPAVLLVEHDVGLVMDVCDHITVLDFGERIAHGTPAAIRDDPAVIAAYLGQTA
ncbi:MAG TPA: ABC transporter ATP-binding protein [Acidimicrobiales bacterium]|nr:ABC transporter ATP-binding protein [Acidimicrobiales bacterium]